MINIRKLKKEDIPLVVDFHRKAIKKSLNTRLGKKHLAKVYDSVRNSNLAIVNIVEVDGKISGVISATTNQKKLSAEIIKTFSQKLLFAINLIIRPWLLYNVFEHFRMTSSVVFNNVLVNACLTSIVVTPESRGKGLGEKLIASVETFFKSQNINCYKLDTFKTNAIARTFYKKLKFIEIGKVGKNVVLVKEIN